MKYAILLNAAPYEHQACLSAYRFAKALLSKQYQLMQVFFYGAGVMIANKQASPPQETFNLQTAWQSLANQFNVPLVICSASAISRGIIDDDIARAEDNVAPGFTIAGLGQLAVAYHEADKVMVFGD